MLTKAIDPPKSGEHEMHKLKAGDVFRGVTRNGHEYHGRVISKDPHGHGGFNWHNSDKQGNIKHEHAENMKQGASAANYLHHSNSLLGDQVHRIGHNPVEHHEIKHAGKTYHYNTTGHPHVDNYMAHHDERYKLWHEHAPSRHKGIYSRNENVNAHTKNGEMVAKFAHHIASGKSPGSFSMKSKLHKAMDQVSGWLDGDWLEKSYVGFEKLEEKIAHKKGSKKVRDPGAVAAAIGRKKYGKKKFQAAAAHGKKMKHMAAKKAAEDWIEKAKKHKKKKKIVHVNEKIEKMGVGW